MNIGDKVRMLHGNEEGVITRFLSNNLVEVEIEDGFQIPVRASEIAVVSQEENKAFGNAQEVAKIVKNKEHTKDNLPQEAIATKGIYAGFLPINDQKSAFYLVNNLDMDLTYTIAQEQSMHIGGLGVGVLKARQTVKVHEVSMTTLEHWGTYIFQFLYYHSTKYQIIPPFIKKIKFKGSNFYKNQKTIPILDKKGYAFQLDQDIPTAVSVIKADNIPEIDTEALAAAMLQSPNEKILTNKIVLPTPKIISTPPKEVDLHIETLTQDYANMNSAEMLQLQLNTFEKHLENAYASGMQSLIFIHGVGNGRLRQEIHKKLSKTSFIKFFKDARKEKFGYGATEVQF